jgi:hypothetical protein
MKRLWIFLFPVLLSAQFIPQYRIVASLPAAGNTGEVVILSTDSTFYKDGPTWFSMGKKAKGNWFTNILRLPDTTSLDNRINKAIDSLNVRYTKTEANALLNGKQPTISNVADTTKYAKKAEANTFTATQTFAAITATTINSEIGWTYQFVTTDSSNNTRTTGTAIGALQWTAAANGFYEVEYSIVDTSAAAATGTCYYWVASGALNRPAVLSVQSPTSATMGTDAFQEDNLTIVIAGTTADTTVLTARPYTSPQIVKMYGLVNTGATGRWITLGWKSEIPASAVTISRGSYVRFRKIY